MNSINLLYIIPLVLTVIVTIYSVIRGKSTSKKSFIHYFIPITVLAIIISTVIIDEYYETQLEIEKEKISKLLMTTQLNEKLFSNSEQRKNKLDSLQRQNKELLDILLDIKNKEKILGEQNKIKADINNKIKSNIVEIGEIEKYNNILDKKVIDDMKGYTSFRNSTNFLFECPTDFESEFLDLKLRFQDEKLISKIKYIYVSFSEKINDKECIAIFDQIYQPQIGVNGFKVKNYFKTKKRIDLEIGYILKSESNKEYPKLESIVCKNY